MQAGAKLDDLYNSHAPLYSIARGDDFGRLRALVELGVDVDVSTLERYMLSRARTHMLTVKIIAYGMATGKYKLVGQTITFSHERVEVAHEAFTAQTIVGALDRLNVLFVGPDNKAGQLEKFALRVPELRARAHVLYNQLALAQLLHGAAPPPAIDELERLLAERSVAAHVHAAWRREDPTFELRALEKASDIAAVRTHVLAPPEPDAAGSHRPAARRRSQRCSGGRPLCALPLAAASVERACLADRARRPLAHRLGGRESIVERADLTRSVDELAIEQLRIVVEARVAQVGAERVRARHSHTCASTRSSAITISSRTPIPRARRRRHLQMRTRLTFVPTAHAGPGGVISSKVARSSVSARAPF